jgi:dCMP deaminase
MSEHRPSRKWDIRHLRMCLQEIATWSKDPSTKVGAILIRGKNSPVSWGYNGPAQSIPDDDPRLLIREDKLGVTVHAELNAILSARQDLSGCTLYVTMPPCANCAATIIQARIGRVVWVRPNEAFAQRWAASLELAEWQFTHARIETEEYHLKEILQ